MKANEAPEKIYLIRNFSSPTALNTTNDHHGKFLDWWCNSREKKADVEYVRTDAFIERACEWIKDNGRHYIDIVNGQLVLKKGITKDFKKYMEG